MTVEFLQTNGGCHTLPESWLSFLQAIGDCVTLFLSIGETSGLIRGVGMKFDVRAMCLWALCFLFGYVFCPRCRGIMWPEGGLTGYSYWVTACILTLNGQGPSIDKIKRIFLV